MLRKVMKKPVPAVFNSYYLNSCSAFKLLVLLIVLFNYLLHLHCLLIISVSLFHQSSDKLFIAFVSTIYLLDFINYFLWLVIAFSLRKKGIYIVFAVKIIFFLINILFYGIQFVSALINIQGDLIPQLLINNGVVILTSLSDIGDFDQYLWLVNRGDRIFKLWSQRKFAIL